MTQSSFRDGIHQWRGTSSGRRNRKSIPTPRPKASSAPTYAIGRPANVSLAKLEAHLVALSGYFRSRRNTTGDSAAHGRKQVSQPRNSNERSTGGWEE